MRNRIKKGQVCQIEGGKNIKNKNSSSINILSIIKVAPGIIILGYAYLYLIGYFYLFSYFEAWGLSPVEIGFSIVDYATIAIYPIFYLVIFFLVIMLMGLYYAHKFPFVEIKNKKVKFLITSSSILLLLVPTFLFTGFMIVGYEDFSISEFELMAIIYLTFGFFWGTSIGLYFRRRRIIKKGVLYAFVSIFVIMLPLFSLWMGGYFGKRQTAYTYNFFKSYSYPSKVIFESTNPISELEIFKENNNRYRGLRLLVYKNGINYFIPDIEEIIIKQRKIRESMETLKKEQLALSIEQEKIETELDSIEKTPKKLKKILPSIKEKLDKLKIKLNEIKIEQEELKKLFNTLSNLGGSTFAIKEDRLKYIRYLKEEHSLDLDKR